MRAHRPILAFLLAVATGASTFAEDAFLGIDARDADGGGVLVVAVVDGGPAANGGVVANDVIVGWNGAKIENLAGLAKGLQAAKPDTIVFLDVRRGDQTNRLQVRLGTRPPQVEEEIEEVEEEIAEEVGEEVEEVEEIVEEMVHPGGVIRLAPAAVSEDRGWMGVMLEPTEDGVRVAQVVEGSPAQKIGIQAGEVIRSIDGKAVTTPDDIIGIVGEKKPGDQVQVATVARREGTELEYTYVFKLGKRPAEVVVGEPMIAIEEVEVTPQIGIDVVPAREAKAGIAWGTDLEAAMKKAAATKHPVMVKFTATWCGPCKMLDQQAFSDREVIDVSKNFVCVKVDIDEQPEVAKKYSVTGIPRVLFLDSSGKTVEEFLGLRPTKDVMATMNSALEKTGGPQGEVKAPTRRAIRMPAAGGMIMQRAPSNDVNTLRREVESLRQEVRELKEMIRKLVEKG